VVDASELIGKFFGHVVEVLDVIREAYWAYRASWRSVITAFLVILLIGIVFGIANFFIGLPRQFLCDSNNLIILLLFCIAPQLLQYILNFINGLINLMVTMAVIKPLDEMASGNKISEWAGHFSKQLVNSILVMVFRAVVTIVCFAPAIIVLITNMSVLFALGSLSKSNNSNLALFGDLVGGVLVAFGGLAVLIIVLIAGFIVLAILNFLLMFLEVEMILGKNGILQAGVKSTKLVAGNFWDALIFSIVWYSIIGGLSMLTLLLMCTCAFCLMPLVSIIGSLILSPVELSSKIVLWRKLTKSG